MSCKENEDELDVESILKLDESISIDGISRTYHIQYPENKTNVPLVVLLHGLTGSADRSLGLGLGKDPQRIWLEVAKE